MMAWAITAFDALLVALLLWLAWQAIHADGLFRAVISFMVFGLLMAVAWVRLDAPDVALAEAAIGAGVTGALLLSALGRLPERDKEAPADRRARGLAAVGLAALALGGATALATIAWALPAPGLGREVTEALPKSGVDNPVTAVLLNIRAFDTLLEIGVLLLAVIATWALGPMQWSAPARVMSPALPVLGRLLFPMFVLVSAYVLWRGGHAPGGAFPAGALMGAGGVLVFFAGAKPWITGAELDPWRWLLSLGLLAMLVVAVGVGATGRRFFEYPVDLAGLFILALEVAAALSIAILLFALCLGGRPPHRWGSEDEA